MNDILRLNARTEAEAARLWCQEMNFRAPENHCGCIGSACSAWIWTDQYVRRGSYSVGEVTEEPPRPNSVPTNWEWQPYDESEEQFIAGWTEPEAEAAKRRKGICGKLAAFATIEIERPAE